MPPSASAAVAQTAQAVRQRQQNPIIYNANGPQVVKLYRGWVYRLLLLELTGTVNVTVAANSVPTATPDTILKRINLRLNGNQILRSYDGPALREMARAFFNQAPYLENAPDGTVKSSAFKSYLPLPLWSPRTIKPITTALDSAPLSALELEVVWGGLADVIGDGTATFTTNPQVAIKSLESFGAVPGGAQWLSTVISQNVAAANSALQVPLPVGQQYRAFEFRASYTDAHGQKIYSDAIINNVKLKSGSTTYFDLTLDDLKGLYALLDDFLAMPAGAYFVDMVTDGYLTEAPDTFGFSELYLEFDCQPDAGGASIIEIFPQQIIPLRGKSA